ncbi:basic proline-rich protein-like [Chionomys nivalis]|uniref:basic proline-rich protein-like n=1 Tax=Chionomys nivalis TaxID=269649 RepID=UPI0025975D34|nr:basic proline-rich protein-like [Chionomys nivalis]
MLRTVPAVAQQRDPVPACCRVTSAQVPNFITLQTREPTDQVPPRDTSGRPSARTHCIRERLAMRSPPAAPQHRPGASPLRSAAPQQQATPPCSPARPPSHPPAVLSPSDPALHPCPPFRGPRATVRCVCPPLRSPKGPARVRARRRGAPLPQCTPSRTFSGDPAGQRLPGGDCGRPSRPGQAQGLGVCPGAPFARSGRRADSSGVPRPRSPQPPAPAASGSGGRHSLTSGRNSDRRRDPKPSVPAPPPPLTAFPSLWRGSWRAPVPPRDCRLPCLALRRGGCSAPAGLRRPLWGQAMLHRALPRGRSAPAPPPSPARPAFPPSFPPFPPPPRPRPARH